MTFTMLFLMGIAGSLHCAGMCGGLAVLAAGSRRSHRLASLSLYLAGKSAIYVFLGALSGALGQAIVSVSGSRILALAGGLLLLAVGLQSLGVVAEFVPGSRRLGQAARFVIRLAKDGGPSGTLLLGSANALLPCPMVYGFLAMAAATGSPIWGAAAMLALAVTSAVPLAICALAGEGIGRLAPFRVSLLAGILMIAMALLMFYRALGPAAFHVLLSE